MTTTTMNTTRGRFDAWSALRSLGFAAGTLLVLTTAMPVLAQQGTPAPRAKTSARPVVAPAPQGQPAPAPRPSPTPAPSPSPQIAPPAPDGDWDATPEAWNEFDYDYDFDGDYDINIEIPDVDVEVPDFEFGPGLMGPVTVTIPPIPPMAPMTPMPPMEPGAARWHIRNSQGAIDESDPARKAYLEGREFVSDSEWTKAADKFNEVVTKFPQSKIVDAALFWYATSLKKQGRYKEADSAAARLLTEYPKSRYANEAKQLQFELAEYVGRPVDIAYQREREDENKAIALQAIFSANPEKAVPIAADLLKPGSTATPKLQQRAALMLGQVNDPRATAVLIDVARGNGDMKVRRQALIGLGEKLDSTTEGDKIFALLSDLARNSTDAEMSRYAISSLGQYDSPKTTKLFIDLATSSKSMEIRRYAISQLGNSNDPAALDALFQIVDTDTNNDVRRIAVAMIGNNDSPRAVDKLVEIGRKDGFPVELRRMALYQLAQRDKGRALDTLLAWYDTEKNETMRAAIVDSLGQSSDKRCLTKLMQAAKSDASPEIRRKAIFWLGQSKDPDALKFLEDLLK